MKLSPAERKRLPMLEREIEALSESIENFATELVHSGDPEREQLAGKLLGVMSDTGFLDEILRPRGTAKIHAKGRAWENAHPEAMAKSPGRK